jgi:hypothetical protein
MNDTTDRPAVHQPDSGEAATATERAALAAHGLWDDSEGPNATRYWSWWAVLDAYRAGFRDGSR